MKKVLITLSLLTFLVFTSCSNILLSRKATIRFATTSSRAATTQTSAEDLTNLVLTGTHNGKTITLGNWEKFSDLNGVEIEIDVGRWDFTLEANLKTKKYRDEISNKIINIGINTLGFNLQKVIISNKTTIANFGETYKTLAAEPENANKTIEIEITEPVVTQEDWTTVATSLNKVENNVYVSLKTTLGNFTRNDFNHEISALKEITVLNSTDAPLTVQSYTFSKCPNVEKITILGNNITAASQSFNEIKNLKTLLVQGSNVTINQYAFYGNINNVDISGENCTISEYAFGTPLGSEIIETLKISGAGTKLKERAFMKSKVKNVIIETKMTSIPSLAFNNCSKLESIQLPNTIETIGTNTFEACPKLKTINLPESIKEIGFMSFASCSELTTINLPSKITIIPNGLFSGCSKLSSITIPANVISIGNNAFQLCSGLTSIEIPEAVTNIGTGAFSSCTNLASVTFKNPNGWIEKGTPNTQVPENTFNTPTTAATYLKAKSDKNFVKENTALTKKINYNLVNSNGEKLSTTPTEYSITSGLTLPASSNLETVTIPSNAAVKLEWHKSPDLSDAAITKLEASECENQATLDLYGKITYTTPVGTASDGITALYNSFTKAGTYSVELTDKITTQELWNTVKTALTQPADKTGVNVALSVGFEGLPTTDKNNKTSEGGITKAAATTAATAVTEVTILPGTTTIGDFVFQNFTNLYKVTLDGDVTNCGDRTFDKCALTEINYKGTMAQWCALEHHSSRLHPQAYQNKVENYTLIINGEEITTELTIPEDVTTIGVGAFKNLTKLNTVKFPKKKIDFSEHMFANCRKLNNVVIPAYITDIPKETFYQCNALDTLTFTTPENIKTLGFCAFSYTGFTEFNFPENVTIVQTGLFKNCNLLTKVTISTKATAINAEAFLNCTNLTGLKIPQNITEIGARFLNGAGTNVSNFTLDFINKTGWKENITSITASDLIYDNFKAETAKYGNKKITRS